MQAEPTQGQARGRLGRRCGATGVLVRSARGLSAGEDPGEVGNHQQEPLLAMGSGLCLH